jgi:hypothetical protein
VISPCVRNSSSNIPAAPQYSSEAEIRDGQPLPAVVKKYCSGRYRTAMKPAAWTAQKNGKVKPSSR